MTVVLTAAALRVWWLVGFPRIVERDGTVYARLAENLVAGAGYRDLVGATHTIFPPGYPLAIASVAWLTGANAELAGRLVSFVAGVVVVIATAALAHRHFGAREALVAAALVATQPRLVDLSTAVLSDSLYAAGLALTMLVALGALKAADPLRVTVVGLASGALACVRPEGYLIGVAFAVALAVRTAGAWRRALLVEAALATGMAVSVVPYSLYLWRHAGQLLTGKWSNARLALAEPSSGSPVARVAEHYVRNVLTMEATLTSEVSLVVLILSGVAAAIALRRMGGPALTYLTLCIVLPLAAFPIFLPSPRFLASVFPLLLVLAAAGVVQGVRDRMGRGARTIAAVLVIVVVLHGAPALSFPLRYSPWGEFQRTEQRMIGESVRARYGAGRRILATSPEAVYYAKGVLAVIPDVGPGELVDVARRTEAPLVILDEILVRRYRPRLLPALEGPAPTGLRLIDEVAPHPGRRVRVFAVSLAHSQR